MREPLTAMIEYSGQITRAELWTHFQRIAQERQAFSTTIPYRPFLVIKPGGLAYQQQILKRAKEKITEAGEYLENNYTIDFVGFVLKECLDDLGKLTGEVFCQEILETIFSNFCIGK